MLNASKSLRRLGLLLAALILLCLTPASARANAPSPSTPLKKVVLSDTRKVERIAVYVDATDRCFEILQVFESQHKRKQEIRFMKPADANRFYLEMTGTDGTVFTSEPIDMTPGLQYFNYDVKTNTLEKAGSNSGVMNLVLLLLALAGALVAPLVFTVLVEVLTALVFRLKPYKHVVVINLITNLGMNTLLHFLRINGHGGMAAVALLEVAVVIAKYFFYIWKYTDQKRGKLLAFTILANALSWGLYALIQPHLF